MLNSELNSANVHHFTLSIVPDVVDKCAVQALLMLSNVSLSMDLESSSAEAWHWTFDAHIGCLSQ